MFLAPKTLIKIRTKRHIFILTHQTRFHSADFICSAAHAEVEIVDFFHEQVIFDVEVVAIIACLLRSYSHLRRPSIIQLHAAPRKHLRLSQHFPDHLMNVLQTRK